MVEYMQLSRSVDITTDLATTPVVRHDGIQMQVGVPSALTLTFWGCSSAAGTYRQIRRRTTADTNWTAFAAATVSPDTEGIFGCPDEVLCLPFLKIIGSAAVTIELFQLGSSRHQIET